MSINTSCLTDLFGEHESLSGITFRDFEITVLGKIIQGHTHTFGHDMFVILGEATVELWTREDTKIDSVYLKAGDRFYVDKDIFHKIIPTVVPYKHSCIFPSRYPDGTISGERTGWREAADATRDVLPDSLGS